jgi:hypothetical protein
MTEPPNPPEKTRIPLWRWAWLGFGLAILLWFGSSAYFQRIAQINEIDYQSGAIEESEAHAKNQSNMHKLMICQIGAGVLALASLTFLVSQTDMRRSRPRPDR